MLVKPPQPLERLLIPEQLDGRHGSNRAVRSGCQLDADNDLQAIQAWLVEYRDSPQTLRNYRKEAERLLLWALLERGRPLSGLTREDCIRYQDFLADPQPRARWCGPKVSRRSSAWRPFQGPLAKTSQRAALLVINSLLNYLVKAGYLAGNPLALVRRRGKNNAPLQRQVERFLEHEQWQALLETVADLPKDTERQRQHYERARFLLALLYLLGPRVSEVAGHTMGSFIQIRGRWWWLVTGKGQKQEKVPVNQDMLEALQTYRGFHGLPALPEPTEATPLVLSLKGTSGVSANMVYRIIKELVNRAATRLEATAPRQAQQLRLASTHWLRHTSITHQADAGISLRFLQRNARHSKMDTTGLYLHTEDEQWHTAMESHRLRKR
ncbi:MAG: tyrosine-type recombinase/integrase [Candidatus Competibacteraceae bacterium]